MSRRVIFPALAVLFLGILPPRPAHAVYHAGQVAPDLHKPGLDGQPYTLYQFRGKVVVLFLLGWY